LLGGLVAGGAKGYGDIAEEEVGWSYDVVVVGT